MPVTPPGPHTPPFIYPKPDQQIAKYFDLTKYLSLLQTKSLFFCRLDQLEDHFEGTVAKPNFEFRIQHQKDLRETGFFKVPMSDEKIVQSVIDLYEFDKKLKSLSCVNCWNKYETESAALWKIYAGSDKGIMLKSSSRKLQESLKDAKQEIYISEIRYLNYENQLMSDGNTMYPVIHKHIAYNYESEIRLIHRVMPEIGWDYDWSKEEIETGFFIEVDLSLLIDEIIVAPYSPKWFLKMVEQLTIDYGIKAPVRRSNLSPTA